MVNIILKIITIYLIIIISNVCCIIIIIHIHVIILLTVMDVALLSAEVHWGVQR